MRLRYVPLLGVLRNVYRIPRGYDRFQQYLRTTMKADGSDVDLVPLLIANPMAKEPAVAMLDAYLALDADGVAARAAAEAEPEFADLPGDYPVSLAFVDDATGGWTNRAATECAYLILGPDHKRFWVTALLWTSDVPTVRAAREAALCAVYRLAHQLRHGMALTLRQKLSQEGWVLAKAGVELPAFTADELNTIREVMEPALDDTDMPTTVSCLFGDEAGASLGFRRQGLPPNAGLALAVQDAKNARARP